MAFELPLNPKFLKPLVEQIIFERQRYNVYKKSEVGDKDIR